MTEGWLEKFTFDDWWRIWVIICQTYGVADFQICMMIINHIEISGLKESVMNVAIYNGFMALKAMSDLWLAQHHPLRVRPLFAAKNPQDPFLLYLASLPPDVCGLTLSNDAVVEQLLLYATGEQRASVMRPYPLLTQWPSTWTKWWHTS